MPAALKRALVLPLILAICLTTAPDASAQIAGVRKAKAIPVILGVVAAGVLLGYGVYRAVHHGHSLRGCSSGAPGDLQLRNEGDQQTYTLAGDVQAIRTGNRIRVSGSKSKASRGLRTFTVTHLSRDYGACRTQP